MIVTGNIVMNPGLFYPVCLDSKTSTVGADSGIGHDFDMLLDEEISEDDDGYEEDEASGVYMDDSFRQERCVSLQT